MPGDEDHARGLVTALAAELARLEPMPMVVRAIFGSEDPAVVAAGVDRYCREQLASAATGCTFATAGVGVVCGVQLADGREAVVKAHRPGVTPARLTAVQAAQRQLAAAGIPAPEPLAGPAPLGRTLATAEARLAAGRWADPHTRAVRAAMARGLARLAGAGRSMVDLTELGTGRMEIPDGALWPPPHDARFDFAASAAGARWIDRLAERARRIEQRERRQDLVVGHTDWRVQNMRFGGDGEVCAVYDWDSLRILPEPALAGKQAASFTTDWSRAVARQYPTIEEALAFVAEFEAARGAPFDGRERRVALAALAGALAYIARCEHSDQATGFRRPPAAAGPGSFPSDSARALLAAHAETLLAG